MKKLVFVFVALGCTGGIMGGGGGGPESAGKGGAPGPAGTGGSGAAGGTGAPSDVSTPPVAGPMGNKDLVGRVGKRLSADQLRATLLELTGFHYAGRATVNDPLAARGYAEKADADILDVFGSALGRPDYNYTVRETLEPGVSFSKLVEDAARYTCGQAVKAEIGEGRPPGGKARLLLKAKATDGLPLAETAIRANVAALALRFWGFALDPAGPEVTDLLAVFRSAAAAPAWTDPDKTARPAGGVGDGWRAVCIALATDPQFFVY